MGSMPRNESAKVIFEGQHKKLKINSMTALEEAIKAGIQLKNINALAKPNDIYELVLCRKTINNWTKILKDKKQSTGMKNSARSALKEEAKRYKALLEKVRKQPKSRIFPHAAEYGL